MKRPIMLLILLLSTILMADTTTVTDSITITFGVSEMFGKLITEYNQILVFLGTVIAMITAYSVLLRGVVNSVRNLYSGIITFWNTWKPTLEGPMKKSFEDNIIKPADEVLERTADIFQKLRLKKIETKLRNIIK